MLLSLFVWLLVRIELAVWPSIGILALSLLALAAFAAVTQRFGAALLIIVILWIVTGIYSIYDAGIEAGFATNLFPFVVVGIAFPTAGALTLALRIPFLIPAVLLIILLPLLTQDLWQLGDQIGSQLATFAAVALGPLLTVLTFRYARTNVLKTLIEAFERLKVSPTYIEDLVNEIKEGPRADESEISPPDEWLFAQLRPTFQIPVSDPVLRDMAAKLHSAFRRKIVYRLLRLTFGSACLFSSFAYLLAWSAIPLSTSSLWVSHGSKTTSVGVGDASVAMPLGPYITVSVLLGIVATSALLAFALTEDRYSEALSDVLVTDPASAAIRFGLPYLKLT